MNRTTSLFAKIFVFITLSAFLGCSENDEIPQFREKLSYSVLTPTTDYSSLFVDTSGNTTVDLTEGNLRLKMFQALNYQLSSNISKNLHIESDSLNGQFSNTGNKFKNISTSSISVVGNTLNTAEVQLKNVFASSLSDVAAEEARQRIENLFDEIEENSHAFERDNMTASAGVPGKIGKILVNEDGIELAQVIQKSLIGALQLDYICNVLLRDGLDANNSKTVAGKNYTALEHNWDVAYGLLTLNQVYAKDYTVDKKGNQVEFAGGSYIWEYNRENFKNVYPAFLTGRAAIVNNDRDVLKAQAEYIRGQFEKAIVYAALGYLAKWKDGTATEEARAHAIGEGLGFIYSLRFATIYDFDAEFSDKVLSDLTGSENGIWDLTTEKVTAAENMIQSRLFIPD